jgi:hypothetical protein
MLTNEELELNNINKLSLTISDDESEYCCICINTIENVFIKLKCCKQFIHEKCIIEFIININNDRYKCPICRNEIQLCESITFGKIIDYINEKKINISKDKLQSVIKNLYKDIPIKDLFNIDGSVDIQYLKDTIERLTVKNDKYRVIFAFISIPLILIFGIIIFNNFK